MKKQIVAVIAISLLGLHAGYAQTYLYTNAPSDSAVSVDSALNYSGTPTADGTVSVIGFGSGSGSGTLSGSGALTLENKATATEDGAEVLSGVWGTTILINSYTGAVTVINDHSAYQGGAKSYAYGFNSALVGDVNGALTVTAKGAIENDAQVTMTDNSAEAYGVNGSMDVGADILAAVTVEAVGGRAMLAESAAESNGYASAIAYGVNGAVSGNLLAPVSVTATAGSARGDAGDAHASAYAIAGSVNGMVSNTVQVVATGGHGDGNGSLGDGSATAVAIDGDVGGLLAGAVYVSATGGLAESDTGAGIATAAATGISSNLVGGLSGPVTVNATGGDVASGSTADSSATATGIGGGLGGAFSGIVNVSAIAGNAASTSGSADADASAMAIGGNLDGLEEFSGQLTVIATGGEASGDAGSSANAAATGISSDICSLTNFSGAVSVTANAGNVITGGSTNAGTATATGITSTDTTTLYMHSGSIVVSASGANAQAVAVSAGNTLDLTVLSGTISAHATGTGAQAYAIRGGSGNDTIELGDVTIIGDIDTWAGTDALLVSGDTLLTGDISSSGSLALVIGQDGFLGFKDNASMGLGSGSMTVSSDATLGVVVTQGDTGTPAVSVDGSVTVDPGGAIAVAASAGSSAKDMMDETYLVVETTGGVTGEFSESERSLFTLAITNSGPDVYATLTGIATQDGYYTPALANSMQALGRTVLGLMADLSSRSEGVRAVVRDPKRPAPQGPAGPGTSGQHSLAAGDWLGYVQQINYMGSQDEDGAVAGYDFRSHGFMIGAEKLINQTLLLGGGAGYLHSRLDGIESAQEGDSDLMAASLYGDWIGDIWHVGGGLSLGSSGTDTERQDSAGDRYKGDFDSSFYGGWLEVGRSTFKESRVIEPYGRTAYLAAEHDGYTDEGGAVPMTVGDNSTENWTTEFGLRVSKTWHRKQHKDKFQLTAKVGWQHEWLDAQVKINNATLGGIPQVFRSAGSDRDAVVIGISEDWFINGQTTLSISYEPVFSGDWYYHSFGGQLSYRF